MSWVVFGAVIRGKPTGLAAVCSDGEWQAMERGEPGCRLLIKSGIATEGEAEWIARATVLAPIPAAA
jgi:hypothetical protein